MQSEPVIRGATYRVQLQAKFAFAEAEAILPHLKALGVTALYTSPILRSTSGSTHGYDVTDHRQVDPELGGDAGLVRLGAALRQENFRWLADFVPNHMAIGTDNPWWNDVLANGPESAYAEFFDIHWQRHRENEPPRVLLAILRSHYGEVLEAGEITLELHDGVLYINAGGTRLPVSRATYEWLFDRLAVETSDSREKKNWLELHASLLEIGRLAAGDIFSRRDAGKKFIALKKEFAERVTANPAVAATVTQQLEKIGGQAGHPATFTAIDALITLQHYRLARWRVGAHEGNYRRFFAIDSLIGLRVESPDVFAASHARIPSLLKAGVTGLRIDHIDGLWDPEEYLERLRALMREKAPPGTAMAILVEKILEAGEVLPLSWPVEGTTGYEFIAQLAGLLVDPSTKERFDDIYFRFTGRARNYPGVLYQAKQEVLDELFPTAVSYLTDWLNSLAERDWRKRDFTAEELRMAIRELMAGLAVYRTYIRAGAPVSPADRETIGQAFAAARAAKPRADSEPLEFVRDVLLRDYTGPTPEEAVLLQNWISSFQQYTGAVMAKAGEDTAFYIYNRLVGLNEVGGDPAVFGADPSRFHEENQARLQHWPQSLLATSTHDTKVSEDVRARLYTLSEMPDAWDQWTTGWRAANRQHKSLVEEKEAPSLNEEYRLYQILLGAWPLVAAEVDATFVGRIREYFRKALNEENRHTTWRNPSEAWLAAADRWVESLLDPEKSAEFLATFRPAAERVARAGRVNSLVQVTLKITCPGVPDFYQGCEAWDFSLVDPDNRRPVDYARLATLRTASTGKNLGGLFVEWRDGGVKMELMRRLLGCRGELPLVFAGGEYIPLESGGSFAACALGFVRSHAQGRIAVVVPRLVARWGGVPLGPVWADTTVTLPSDVEWRNILSENGAPFSGVVPLRTLLAEFPIAVLVTG